MCVCVRACVRACVQALLVERGYSGLQGIFSSVIGIGYTTVIDVQYTLSNGVHMF